MRLFLVPTLLLVGITTVAIGAPVAETIKVIEAVKIPQMESNITLNRRVIGGIPGIAECTDPKFPDLMYSNCLDKQTIRAICASEDKPEDTAPSYTVCSPDTTCEAFKTLEGLAFALCLEEGVAEVYHGILGKTLCQTYEMEGITEGMATLSINAFDSNQQPAPIPSISVYSENQHGSTSNANNFALVVNTKNKKKVKVCLTTAITKLITSVFFCFLNGAYSSKKYLLYIYFSKLVTG
ncbi:hypothetical protein Glove_276g81 [Diversispora epigaea]|uniref:Uncharacterized protein n=1 Tax=Diversispora epigaea TaxID=1348612 RepID=A0A397I2W9_9GLOM|nr:hypothetical protein Glove_276g81 [Diversispora epigaea]